MQEHFVSIYKDIEREVGKVGAQQLAPDQVRRIVRQEVHARHHGVDRDHQLAPGGRGEHRGVVAEPERAGITATP